LPVCIGARICRLSRGGNHLIRFLDQRGIGHPPDARDVGVLWLPAAVESF
jgi:hypothetical protein